MLTVYQAQPASRTEQALTLLATIATDQRHHPAGIEGIRAQRPVRPG
jgi:hypothetical protein